MDRYLLPIFFVTIIFSQNLCAMQNQPQTTSQVDEKKVETVYQALEDYRKEHGKDKFGISMHQTVGALFQKIGSALNEQEKIEVNKKFYTNDDYMAKHWIKTDVDYVEKQSPKDKQITIENAQSIIDKNNSLKELIPNKPEQQPQTKQEPQVEQPQVEQKQPKSEEPQKQSDKMSMQNKLLIGGGIAALAALISVITWRIYKWRQKRKKQIQRQKEAEVQQQKQV